MHNSSKTSLWGYAVRLLLHHGEIFGKWGPWVALGGFLLLEWFVHATAAVVEHGSECVFEWRRSEGMSSALTGAILPFLFLLAALIVLFLRVRRIENLRGDESAHAHSVIPHRGLIASVSLLSNIPATAVEHRSAIQTVMVPASGAGPNPRDNVLKTLYATPWGPLAAAVELHSPRLQHVWLLCTDQVKDDFLLVKSCIQYLCPHPVSVDLERIKDRNNLHQARRTVDAIYRSLDSLELKENQVIADITGGTAAMSAGIILATLDENRQVEYLSQDLRHALVSEGQIQRDLKSIFQYVETSPEDVARAFASLLEHRSAARNGSVTAE